MDNSQSINPWNHTGHVCAAVCPPGAGQGGGQCGLPVYTAFEEGIIYRSVPSSPVHKNCLSTTSEIVATGL